MSIYRLMILLLVSVFFYLPYSFFTENLPIYAQVQVTPTATISPSPSPTISPSPSPTISPSLESRISVLENELQDLKNGAEKPEKDIWDIINAFSGLLSGILIAIVGGIATYVYREREKSAEDARTSLQIAVDEKQNQRSNLILEVQTVESFMPWLQSEDPRAVRAALLAISALGNSNLVGRLAELFGLSEGVLSALSQIQSSGNQAAAKQAEQSLEALFSTLQKALVIIEGKGIGTGFFVSSDGYIITMGYLVNEAKEIRVKHGTNTYQPIVVSAPSGAKPALIKIEGKDFPVLTLNKDGNTYPNERIFVLGRDVSNTNSIRWAFSMGQTEGYVLEDSGSQFIRAKIDVEHGYGGAPVFNAKSEVIGIVQRMNRDKQYALITPSTNVIDLLELATND